MRFRMDPRAKLYLLLLANLMLFFHVSLAAEAIMAALFLLLFFLSGCYAAGLRLTAIYGVLLALDLWAVPRAENSPFLNVVALFSVGIRMMLPCIITGAYAFSTTTAGELVLRAAQHARAGKRHHSLRGGHPLFPHGGRGLPPDPRGHGAARHR